ncbi:uncharacterized protein BYT42DRAFT_588004 [Radiomyces spectabilis]|uniref:uncharacterized protein n=1 Tax=Radiomyces spectabilis TaxID=64574 RepID=UPI00222048EA|nr:uncharacterized protein BYT42DRAFT_588004 [Radiomyces spectabilis]KAI8366827.1 hypothetical protein BYT42DRAFT_588004 [Radiomyces spectabilis]
MEVNSSPHRHKSPQKPHLCVRYPWPKMFFLHNHGPIRQLFFFYPAPLQYPKFLFFFFWQCNF